MLEVLNGYKIERRDGAPHVVRVGWKEPIPGTAHIHDRVSMVVMFGLHYLRGNRQPHFSVTADGKRNGRDDFGGCCHELILSKVPALADVVALHLADMDGAPMHAEANGWYSFAASLGGLTETYHAGNSERHMPRTPPEGEPWRTTEYRRPTADECAAIFAEHVRITPAAALELRESFAQQLAPSGYSRAAILAARGRFAEWINEQRPRWKAEADAVIAAYGFKPYGDHWPVAA